MTTVAEHLRDYLVSLGTSHFFQVTGGDVPLFLALDDSPITMVPCRSEGGATYMADGYARASGRLGWVYGQHGPGATNVAAALADAYWAASPVISITSSVARGVVGQHAYQEVDQLAMYRPVTKLACAAGSVEQVPAAIRAVVKAATEGGRGPTHLEIPRDLFGEPIPPSALTAASSEQDQVSAVPDPATAAAINDIASALAAAKRPIMLAGGGVIAAGAWSILVETAEALQLPVCTSLAGKSVIDDDHPLSVGVAGRYSRKVANELMLQADVVLVVGDDLGEMATDAQRIPAPSARILSINAAPTSLPRAYAGATAVVGDLEQVLSQLVERVPAAGTPGRDADWLASVQAAVHTWREVFATAAGAPGPAIHPASVMQLLNELLRPGDIVVADTGYMSAWAGALVRVPQSGRSFLRAAGSLGWAIPGSIGAALWASRASSGSSAPAGRVFCITGDGGAAYHLAEVETAARLGVNVTILVLNNACLAFEYQLQRYMYDHVVASANDFSLVDFAQVAQGYGARGLVVSDIAQLAEALNSTASLTGPTVIDVRVDREPVPPVTSYDRVMERSL